MLEITNLRQGAILNHHHGKETADGLTITLEGIGDGHPVRVNGEPAEMFGKKFAKEITLREKFNKIIVSEMTGTGLYSQEIVLVWDKKSFKRFESYIDDHSFVFTDLTKERPKSAFDHFYLKGLKNIHDKYGWRVTLNCFFRNDHEGKFTLDQMPDIWKQEFIDNSDWLKFAFHAKSEFPDRPYLESSVEEFARDYDEVCNEIIRFAGEECCIAPSVIHWGNIHPLVAQECVKRGMTNYSLFMCPSVMGGPSLADRQKGGDMSKAPSREIFTNRDDLEGYALLYDDQERKSYLAKYGCCYDPLTGLVLRSNGTVCCNLVPLDQIETRIKNRIEATQKSGAEILMMASHEQYTFPYYINYLPDHMQRIELAAKTLIEAGYEPIFFNDGFMGNTAWDQE